MANKRRKQSTKLGYGQLTPVETPSTDISETELARIWNTLNAGEFALKDYRSEENVEYTMLGFKWRDLMILMGLVKDRMTEIKNIERVD